MEELIIVLASGQQVLQGACAKIKDSVEGVRGEMRSMTLQRSASGESAGPAQGAARTE